MTPIYDDDPGRPLPRPRRHAGPPRSSVSGGGLLLLVVGFVGLVVVGVGLWVGVRLLSHDKAPPLTNPDVQLKEVVSNGPMDADETESNTVFESDKDSVVNVDTVALKRGLFDTRGEQQTGTGSGFVWDTDGRIVTNYHVVEEAVKQPNMALRVVMADRTTYDARIVGTAPDYDLAVVQITAPKDILKPLGLADSGDLKVGQKVFAIGNPFGLSLTLTTGIISNLDRTIDAPTGAPIPKAIQHTAQINPGNSGGPLLNRHGKLVGVNTAIVTGTRGGGHTGIGFSIPSNTVNQVVTEIIKTGRTGKVDLGVRLYDQKALRRAGYDQGVMIAEVIPGGPADRAKLRGLRKNPATGKAEPGDIILSINGQAMVSPNEFQSVVSRLVPGSKIKVRYLRDDEEWEITMSV